MKTLITGKNAKNITKLVKSLCFEIVTSNPDVIISYGGDGTLLTAERKYPGVPKLPLRDSLICNKCPAHKEEALLQGLLKNRLQVQQYLKLQTSIAGQIIYALNDFVIRNTMPIHTIRFKVTPQDKLLIGDGIVVATPFGSTGYFQSITRQTFIKGFGVAFNNTTEEVPPLILKEKEEVNFKLIRGKATLTFDNSPDIFTVDEGSQILFKLSDKVARIYEDTSLRCPNCRIKR